MEFIDQNFLPHGCVEMWAESGVTREGLDALYSTEWLLTLCISSVYIHTTLKVPGLS